jgi:hypothetical protein
MSDEDDRTTPIGLFNYAHTYWRSAVTLHKAKVRVTHRDAPTSFLYCHAIELYLKAYLRAHDVSAETLRTKYGHDVSKLANAAKAKGLHFDDEDTEVLQLITDMKPLTIRYIKTGPFRRPTHEALNRTCKSFHQSVKGVAKKI